MSPNIYTYRHDFNENNGRFFTIEYLLFTIQIVQPLQRSNVPKSIKRVTEPTIISLNGNGNMQSKGTGHRLKSSKEQRAPSFMKNETRQWIQYAEENLHSAKLLIEKGERKH